MQGTYLLCLLLFLSFAFEPEATAQVLTTVSLKLQTLYINYRLKWMAWRMYRQLCRITKESGMPGPGPFRFINIWDRDSNP